MRRLEPEVRALLWKELRQVRRSRGAIVSSTLLPFFILVLAPLSQLLALRGVAALPPRGGVPPGLGDPHAALDLFTAQFLPLLVVIGGLMVPSVAATYTVIVEKERRSLELLMALPVSVRDILAAKILATLALAGIVVVPMFAIDAVVLLALGAASVGLVVLLLALLLAALACSGGLALLLALLARDFRTARNVTGFLYTPLILIAAAILFAFPPPARLLILIGVLLAAGLGAVAAALRWLTFERYLA